MGERRNHLKIVVGMIIASILAGLVLIAMNMRAGCKWPATNPPSVIESRDFNDYPEIQKYLKEGRGATRPNRGRAFFEAAARLSMANGRPKTVFRKDVERILGSPDEVVEGIPLLYIYRLNWRGADETLMIDFDEQSRAAGFGWNYAELPVDPVERQKHDVPEKSDRKRGEN